MSHGFHIERYWRLALLLTVFASAGAHRVLAQDAECSDDRNDQAMNYSLYFEDFKNGNFESALPYLKWILRCAPGFPGNNDRNYERARDTYEGIGMGIEDPDGRRVYLDSALYIFDTAVPALQEAGIEVDPYDWVFEKGRFIQGHADDLPDLQGEVGGIYREAFEMAPERIQPYYINYVVLDLINQGDKAAAVEFLDQAEELRGSDPEVAAMITDWRGRLFTSPEERIGFLESQLEKKPEDADMTAELFQLLMTEGYRDRVYDLAPKMLKMDPSARTYRLIGKMRLEDGQTARAIELYEESLKLPGGESAAKEVNYNIGLAHQQEGRLSRARTSFRAALDADPNYGAAIKAIGDLYVAAVQGCGSFEREDRAVYWLAADYYDRAASRDPSIAAQARQGLNNIRRYMPTAEDKFFKSWNAGDSYTVNYGCYQWINETTRVR